MSTLIGTNYDIGYPVPNSKPAKTNKPIEQGSTFLLPFSMVVDAATLAYLVIDEGLGTVLDAEVSATYEPNDGAAPTAFDITILEYTAPNIISGIIGLDSTTTAAMAEGSGRWDCEIAGKTIPTGFGAVFVMKPFGIKSKAKVVGESNHA